MTLFPEPGPRVFGLPPGADFAAALARGVRKRLGAAPPEALARIRIVLNTGAAIRAATRAFEEGAGEAGATFLPRLLPIARFGAGAAETPPEIGDLERLLTVTRLVSVFLGARPEFGAPGGAPGLAASLISLLDDFAREGAPLSALDHAAETDPAAHWRRTLEFLDIVKTRWPEHLAEIGRIEPETARRRNLQALLAEWAEAPPEGPVLAAGSTGSTRARREALAAIAALPQGAVLLPGFDFDLPEKDWARIGPDHPQFGHRELLDSLGLLHSNVRRWDEAEGPGPRARLLSAALRPAPATDGWLAALPELEKEAEAATAGLSLIEAESPAREAEAIALLMRRALDGGEGPVALATPDILLARRVAAALGRWGLTPDVSAGEPLRLKPAGVFAALVARLMAPPFDQSALLALLKHPLTAQGEGRRAHLSAVARLELRGLRRRDTALRLGSVADVLAEETGRKGEPKSPLAAPPLRAALEALAPFQAAAPLEELVARHRAAAEALAGEALFERADGAALQSVFAAFAEAAPRYGEAQAAEYPALLSAAMEQAGEVRDKAQGADPRLLIVGVREARNAAPALMILGGLNEGTWPAPPPVDPWLSRQMRARSGLPSPERRIGLAAHDFLSAAATPRAVLTRALRAEGAPTTPSRWLSRLSALLGAMRGGAPLDAMRARGRAVLASAETLRRAPKRDPAKRPAPLRPGVRLDSLSVTEIERLIRDPYAIYARRILKLEPLDPIGAAADARDLGTALHEVVERFVAETMEAWPGAEAAGALFDRIAAETVAGSIAAPAQALAWEMRLRRLRDWFLEEEEARRALGRPLALEADGVFAFETAGGPFRLRGRADRVDLLAEGGLAIYDYKSGGAPSSRQIALFQKQLPLLALIAERAGLGAVPRGKAERLAYIGLTGSGEGGKTTDVAPEPDAFGRLVALLEAFEGARPFLARAYPEMMRSGSDFEHLSRYGEWPDRAADAPPAGAPEPER